MLKCVTCDVENTKYKCPNCLAAYCSSACYKQHKELKCKPVEKEVVEEENVPKYFTEDTVSETKLSLLGQSDDLKGMLVNPHLQKILTSIDDSPNPDELLQKAMLEPIFVEFANRCLKIVE